MDENTNHISIEDQELLETVERAISGKLQLVQNDSESLEALCVGLAASTPIADDSFRQALLARLQAEQVGGGAQLIDVTTPAGTKVPSVSSKSTAPSARVAHSIDKSLVLAPKLAGRSQGYSRIGRVVLGVLGVAAMLVLFVVLIAQFSRRVDVNVATKGTPTVAAIAGSVTPISTVIAIDPPIKVTPIDSIALVPELRKLYTILLGANDGSLDVWSPDGKLLAKTSGDVVQIWDVESGALKNNIPLQGDTSSYTLTWSPDGKMLALTAFIGRVKVYSVSDGALLLTLTPAEALQEVRFSKPVAKVAWSPDGNYIASVFFNVVNDAGVNNSFITPEHPLKSIIYVWDVATGMPVHELSLPDDQTINSAESMVGPGSSLTYVTGIAWSPDGKMISAVFTSQLIAVWEVASEKLAGAFSNPSVIGTTSTIKMQWSPNSRTIAEAQPNFIELWDLASGQSRTLPNPAPPQAISYPVSTADSRLNPTATSTYVYAREGYGNLSAFAWSPDGSKIITLDGLNNDQVSLRLWDPASATQIYRLQVGDASKFGVTANTPAFSPDGQVILNGVSDAQSASLVFRNGESGVEIRTLFMPNALDASWSPDGSLLAITTLGGIEIWGDPAAHRAVPTTIASTPVPVCGTWSLVDAPIADNMNDLQAVTALADNDAWAVGYSSIGSPAYMDLTPVPDIPTSLTLHWDGKTWRHIEAPHVGSDGNQLMGVAGVSSNDVWAVGYTGIPQYAWTSGTEFAHTLIMHWDGTGWSVVPAPTNDHGSRRLSAVSALAPDDVWAVGYSGGDDDGTYPFMSDPSATSTAGSVAATNNGTPTISSADMARTKTLILHWDGKSWSEVASPSPGVQSNKLNGISALAKDAIWAVGVTNGDSSLHGPFGYSSTQPFVLFWDGKSWANVPSPNIGNSLTGVSAADNEHAWIVGAESTEGSSDMRMMAWDGVAWTVVAVPTPSDSLSVGPPQSGLSGVLALKPNDVWAIGGYPSAIGSRSVATVLHWDGVQWTYVPTPNLSGQNPNGSYELSALAVTPSGDLWAIGTSFMDLQGSTALILRYDASKCR